MARFINPKECPRDEIEVDPEKLCNSEKNLEKGESCRYVHLNALINSLIRFGIPFSIPMVIFMYQRWNHIGVEFKFAYALVVLWFALVPHLLWRAETVVIPELEYGLREIIDCKDDNGKNSYQKTVRKIQSHVKRLKNYKKDIIFWAILIPLEGLIVATYLQIFSETIAPGMMGKHDPWFYPSIIPPLLLGYFAALGFFGGIIALRIIREIERANLSIDPLNPDGLGGMSVIGKFSIELTKILSTGALFFPMAFAAYHAGEGSRLIAKHFVMIIMGMYAILVAVSFFYPTWRIYKVADEKRSSELANLRDKYKRLREELKNCRGNDCIEKFTQLEAVKDEFILYRDVSVYPLQIDIILELTGAIILPIMVYILQVIVAEIFGLPL